MLSLRLRNGQYVALQRLSEAQVTVFDVFLDADDWSDIELSADNVLLMRTLLKSVFQYSESRVAPELKAAYREMEKDRVAAEQELAQMSDALSAKSKCIFSKSATAHVRKSKVATAVASSSSALLVSA